MEKSLKIKGFIYLALIPILLFIVNAFSLTFVIVAINGLIIIDVYTLAIFLTMLFRKIAYTDSEVMDLVIIPNAPEEIDALIKKKTTRNNRLINVNVILVLGKKKKLTQSDLVKQIEKLGIENSQTSIIKYLTELEEAEILKSKKEYTREYHLTQKGEWCFRAVKKCFPTRFLFFVIRHYLGFRKLPPYPQ